MLIARVAAELTVKGPRVRQEFNRALSARVAEALERRRISHRLEWRLGRLLIDTEAPEDAATVLARVFGLSSVSPVAVTAPAELDAIVAAGTEAFSAEVQGKSYAVRAKRQGKHAFGTTEIERALGAALNDGARVDLEQPDVTVGVEVLGETAYLFSRRIEGASGLPAAVRGRALALTSGGFDSAVAAWRVMKRGVAVDHVFCNLGGGAYERMVLQVVKLLSELWCFGHRPMLHVVDFGPLVATLRERVGQGYWQVALKRLMYRVGALVARELEAEALITGESIGQVSSQTLANLRALDAAPLGLPLLRPLIGADKLEIIAEARRIGTAPLSERIKEYCALGGSQPVLAARPRKLDAEVAKIDEELIAAAVAERRVIDVLAASAADLKLPYLMRRDVPEGAVVIDCQPAHLFRRAHVPGAVHRDAGELLEHFRELDKGRTYLLYCTHGPQAAALSAVMQEAGYEAYAYDGGVRALLRQLGQG